MNTQSLQYGGLQFVFYLMFEEKRISFHVCCDLILFFSLDATLSGQVGKYEKYLLLLQNSSSLFDHKFSDMNELKFLILHGNIVVEIKQ